MKITKRDAERAKHGMRRPVEIAMYRSLLLLGVEGPYQILVTYRYDWRMPVIEVDTPDFTAVYNVVDERAADIVNHSFDPGYDGYEVRCELMDGWTKHPSDDWGKTRAARVRHCRDNWKVDEALRTPLYAMLNRAFEDVMERQGWSLQWPNGAEVTKSERDHLYGALAHVIRQLVHQ